MKELRCRQTDSSTYDEHRLRRDYLTHTHALRVARPSASKHLNEQGTYMCARVEVWTLHKLDPNFILVSCSEAFNLAWFILSCSYKLFIQTVTHLKLTEILSFVVVKQTTNESSTYAPVCSGTLTGNHSFWAQSYKTFRGLLRGPIS